MFPHNDNWLGPSNYPNAAVAGFGERVDDALVVVVCVFAVANADEFVGGDLVPERVARRVVYFVTAGRGSRVGAVALFPTSDA